MARMPVRPSSIAMDTKMRLSVRAPTLARAAQTTLATDNHISTISEWNPGPLSTPMVGISTSLTRALTLIRPSL